MADLMGPVRTERFEVDIADIDATGFKRVELPAHSTQMNEYREGTDPVFSRRLWGQTQYEDLTLERGAKSGDKKLYDWRKKVVDGKMEEARKDIAISILNSIGEAELRYEFVDAWPKEYQPPSLDASGGGNDVATETIIVSYNEMDRVE
jgi:phage tail-like protein